MKKLLIIPVMMATFASAEGYTQAQRIADMQTMAQAMQDIQSGFFYNNIDIIKDGAKTLADTIVKVQAIDSEIANKDIYERWLQNDQKMSNKIKKKIKSKTETMVERFSDGDAVQALQNYNKITQECLKCHIRLRKW
jgi:hypothetical protein